MKKLYLFFAFTFLLASGFAQQFDNYFKNKALRLDYYHTGTDTSETYSFDEMIMEPYWAGPKTNLVDTLDYGKYYFKVYSVKNDSSIYSHGYSTLFGEWQTTDEAKTTRRTFSESVIFPFPKENVRVEFYSRSWEGKWVKKFEYLVSPFDKYIKRDRRLVYPSFDVWVSGKPENKVDIVLLPEGYTEEEMGKFIDDCRKFSDAFFPFSPYTENKDKFNIRGVLAPSSESGADNPGSISWENTILDASYYTFGTERYLMTRDYKSVCDLAANAPYDQIYILVNSRKYGGGSIYNYYNVSVTGSAFAPKIMIHEFGHGFAGLGDEYYTSETGYNNFYNLKVEPWEPNLTTLVAFDRKWKDMMKKNTPIPTPDIKKYYHTVGVFEGAGYVAKGVYRPYHDCLMNSFDGNKFCPVCTRAIQRMIDFYSE